MQCERFFSEMTRILLNPAWERLSSYLADSRRFARTHDLAFSSKPTGDSLVRTSVRHLVRLVSMPLALLGAALLSPSAARAGCEFPNHVERIHRAEPSDVRLVPAKPAQPCPCTGPTCSRRPLAPTMPLPLERLTSQDWGCPILPLAITPTSLTAFQADAEAGDPIRRASSIFHPPRISSHIASL